MLPSGGLDPKSYTDGEAAFSADYLPQVFKSNKLRDDGKKISGSHLICEAELFPAEEH